MAAGILGQAQTATTGGLTFTNRGLIGVGRVSASQRDRLGETFGSLSGLAIDPRTWRRNTDGSYTGTLYTQPDRGYTKSGVAGNYRPRRHRFTLTLKPDTNGSSKQDQVTLTLNETTLLTDPAGLPLTGLDPTLSGGATLAGFPRMPQAYTSRLALDAEGLALLPDGTFFVCDEYGPYLLRFSAGGALLGAVRPPEAFIPKRNAADSFSSDSAAAGQPTPSPREPDAGRENSQGFEGLSVTSDGNFLYALMQSALRQDGGAGGSSLRRYARLLEYNISTPSAPSLTGEYILPLPLYSDGGVQQVASAGDLVALNGGVQGAKRFLVLARDGNGRGSDNTKSLYRAVLVYDISAATNIAGSVYDNPNTPAAPGGVLASAITPAVSAVVVDLNNKDQLDKFGLNNSSNDNSDTLSEKWESLALAPALDATAPDDFFLLVGNDNDFSTTDGYQDGTSFKAGQNIDTMVLAYRITAPGTYTLPTITTQPASRTAVIGQAAALSVAALGNPTPTFQWQRNGIPLAGATGNTLAFAAAQTADSGSYNVIVTNASGSVTSATATLTVNGLNVPAFSTQPAGQVITAGTTVVFAAVATNSPAYQWFRDGVPLPGATRRMLLLARAGVGESGTYTATASNGFGTALSTPANLAVLAGAASTAGRLVNLSILSNVTAADPVFTVGTVIGGAGTSGTKPLLVRAAGPSLGPLGVNGALADPKLEMFAGGAVFAANDNWGGGTGLSAVFAQVGAFDFAGPTSRDAAVYSPATPARDYTVQISGVGGATGTVIAELYDATAADTLSATSPRLVNLSVLKQIPAGNTLTAGFVIAGSTAKTVLIRAIGPRLALDPFRISGAMVDPKLELFAGQTSIASNDNWGGEPEFTTAGTAVAAFAIADPGSRDAMILVTLPPGAYTAQASGMNNTGGLALVEFYEVP
jgi:hypothetical protein